MNNLAGFCFLWSIAELFQLTIFAGGTPVLLRFLLVFSSAWVLLRPFSFRAILALILLQMIDVLRRLPFLFDNWWLVFFVDSAFLLVLVCSTISSRRFPPSGDDFFKKLAPIIRVEVLLFYLFPFFAKLNVDFLTPEFSCATFHYLQLSKIIPFLPTAMGATAVCLALLVEGAIPLLLVFPKARLAGIVLAAFFHFMMGINRFDNNILYGFSALFIALLSFFWPFNLGWRQYSLQRALTLLFLGLALFISIKGTTAFGIQLALWLWWFYGLSFLSLLLWFLTRRSGRNLVWPGRQSFFGFRPFPYVLLPLAIFLNGLSPYIGSKTVGSFTFHSNLQTEAGVSNHLIFPSSFQFLNFQKDLVRIVGSSDPVLQRQAERKNLWPYFSLRVYLHEAIRRGGKKIEIRYVRGGQERRVENAGADPEFLTPPPFLLRKLLFFRAVRPGERTSPECKNPAEWGQFFIS